MSTGLTVHRVVIIMVRILVHPYLNNAAEKNINWSITMDSDLR